LDHHDDDPQVTHRLLRIITDFLKRWHALQRETIDSIDGIMLLDDIVGFIGEEDFLEFAYPYLKELYEVPVSVKLFHNDADCRASVKYYADMGVNLYNPGIYLSLSELREMTKDHLPILGLIPPRDVLAAVPAEQ
jgi:uroporphyrinogen decarboxylase